MRKLVEGSFTLVILIMVTTRRNVLQIHPSVLAKELTSKSKSIEAHNANIEQIREQNRIRRWDNESPAI